MTIKTSIALGLGTVLLGISGAAYAQTSPSSGTPMQTTPVPPSTDQSTLPSPAPSTAPVAPTPDAQPTPDASASATAATDTSTPPGKKKKGKKPATTPQ